MSCREAKAANRSPTLTIIAINWVVLASSSGEQVRAGLRESDEGAAVVEFKPAAFDGEREARRILFRSLFLLLRLSASLTASSKPPLNTIAGISPFHPAVMYAASRWCPSIT